VQSFFQQYIDTQGCMNSKTPPILYSYLEKQDLTLLNHACFWDKILVNILQGNVIDDKVYHAVMNARQNLKKINQNEHHQQQTAQKTEI